MSALDQRGELGPKAFHSERRPLSGEWRTSSSLRDKSYWKYNTLKMNVGMEKYLRTIPPNGASSTLQDGATPELAAEKAKNFACMCASTALLAAVTVVPGAAIGARIAVGAAVGALYAAKAVSAASPAAEQALVQAAATLSDLSSIPGAPDEARATAELASMAATAGSAVIADPRIAAHIAVLSARVAASASRQAGTAACNNKKLTEAAMAAYHSTLASHVAFYAAVAATNVSFIDSSGTAAAASKAIANALSVISKASAIIANAGSRPMECIVRDQPRAAIASSVAAVASIAANVAAQIAASIAPSRPASRITEWTASAAVAAHRATYSPALGEAWGALASAGSQLARAREALIHLQRDLI